MSESVPLSDEDNRRFDETTTWETEQQLWDSPEPARSFITLRKVKQNIEDNNEGTE